MGPLKHGGEGRVFIAPQHTLPGYSLKHEHTLPFCHNILSILCKDRDDTGSDNDAGSRCRHVIVIMSRLHYLRKNPLLGNGNSGKRSRKRESARSSIASLRSSPCEMKSRSIILKSHDDMSSFRSLLRSATVCLRGKPPVTHRFLQKKK